ncbi:hypothetical protein Taro_018529 [Colocasia esculenta]|uniref:Transposase (putative) gypsy type domain-containing protein n=1 Tax=Colocasia esculenta TaxID=4460 RepID=A0A843UIW7_COLES|nr:hypothetical protein [Colocasia esculenta]
MSPSSSFTSPEASSSSSSTKSRDPHASVDAPAPVSESLGEGSVSVETQIWGLVDDSFVLELVHGTYVPKDPSAHTSGARRRADNVAEARCETSPGTFKWLRKHPRFVLPADAVVFANRDFRAHYVLDGGFSVYTEAVRAGLCFPFHPFVIFLLLELGVAPSQLAPNAWRVIVGFLSLYYSAGVPPTSRLFLYLFSIKPFGDWFYFAARNGRHILGRLPSSLHGWKRNFVFVYSSSGWPFPTKWSAVDVRSKAFGSPRLTSSELYDLKCLKEVEPPNLIDISDELFQLIKEGTQGCQPRSRIFYSVLGFLS